MDFAAQNSSAVVRLTRIHIALVVATLMAAAPNGRIVAQQALSPVVAKSPNNVAAGAIGDTIVWDLSATDCTYKAEKREVWVVDSHSED